MTSHFYISAFAFAVGLGPAGAAILFSDPFTDGDLVAGADNSGIAWYDRSVNSGISIVDDAAGINSGNALRFARTGAAMNNRGLVGVLNQTITLANPGDFVTLSFSFRLISTAGTTSPNDSTVGFTFGLYNSNSSVVSGNDTVDSDNDFGFRGEFGTGTISAVGAFKETNVPGSAGGLGTGSDGGAVTLNSPVAVGVNDFTTHTGSITLTYNSPSDLNIALMYDGGAVGNGTSSVPFLAFDEIVFSQGGSNGFVLDNVEVTSNVPEPGMASLVALFGVMGIAGYRRR